MVHHTAPQCPVEGSRSELVLLRVILAGRCEWQLLCGRMVDGGGRSAEGTSEVAKLPRCALMSQISAWGGN
jgi:hypothetical protein